MVKQFLKIAGVKTQKEFYEKYPTEQAFFKAHPEARQMAEGGSMQDESAGDAASQQQQLIQAVAQMLQQGAQPQQVAQKLTEMGMQQEQAVQLVTSVVQQMQQAQPGMAYGGMPMAATGMQVAPSFGATIPDVSDFANYDSYKNAYNTYLKTITTDQTTFDPNEVYDMSGVIETQDALNDPDLQKIARKPVTDSNAIINPNGKSIVNYPSENLGAEDIKRPSTGGVGPWGVAGIVGGTLLAGKVMPTVGKFIKRNTWDRGVNKWGNVDELNKTGMTPEMIKALEIQAESIKRTIANQGYTVGKADVNSLVSAGMTKQEATEFLKDLPDKKTYEESIKAAKKKGTTTPANTTPATPPTPDPMADEIGKLMDHDYYKNALKDNALEPTKRVDYELRVKDPETWLKNQINSWTDTYQAAIKNGDAASVQSAKTYLDNYNTQLDELGKIKTKYSGATTPTASTPAATATPATATQTATAETKKAIQTRRNTPPVGKSKAVIASETEANKIISEMIRTGKRSAAQMDKLNALGMDNVSVLRQLKGKKVIATNPAEYATRNKYIVSGMDKVANITKILEEIKIARQAGKLREVGELSEALRVLKEIPKKFGGEYADGGFVPTYAEQAYGALNLPQFAQGSYYTETTTTMNPRDAQHMQEMQKFLADESFMKEMHNRPMPEGLRPYDKGDDFDPNNPPQVGGGFIQKKKTLYPGIINIQGITPAVDPHESGSMMDFINKNNMQNENYANGGNYPWNGTWNGNQGFEHGGMYHNPFEEPSGLRKFVYADGGMSPEEAAMMEQQQGQQAPPQQGGGAQDAQMQQLVQEVAQALQQGADPEQVMQQLVQEGVPQEVAQQIIQMVMEQLQGGAQQQAPPQEAMQQQPPMRMYGGGDSFNYGGMYANGGQFQVGQEMDVTPAQLEELRRQGIEFKIIK